MSDARVTHPPDLDAFERAAGAYLAAREVEHTVLLGVCASLRAGLFATHAPYLAVVERTGRVTGVALRTPPFNVLVSVSDDAALAALADDLAERAPDLPGVTAEREQARAFAARYSERTGRAHRVHMAERLFRLDAVVPPRPVPGALRAALASDRDLLGEWLDAFSREALAQPVEDRGRAADAWLERRARRMYVWDDGGPVSLCGVSARTASTIRVAPVYTPPALRGRGYASACVAAVSQAQLDAGVLTCLLFTDLANPTSNKIYQAVGYRPVRDFDDIRFAPRA